MQQLKVGSSLQGGKYKIEKVLGQGGFGITYLATQELLDRKVCIKEFFFKEYCERDEATSQVSLGTQSNHELVERFMAKFLKEARTISQLEHPHIIRIHDIFKENNTAYYVMEYIEGESLADRVNHYGCLPESEAVEYIKQVASALDFIHQQSINHLDVKPANIMIRKSDNKAVLIDFGLSKQYDAQGGQTSTTPVGISHGYAPMEQYNVGGVSTFSPQTDIYSLGATLYKLVTGNIPPHAGEVLNEGLPELPFALSTNVKNAINQAMQVRKKDRPESIILLLNLLNNEDVSNTIYDENSHYNQEHDIEDTKVIQRTHPAKVIVSKDIPDDKKPQSKRKIYLRIILCLILVIVAFHFLRFGFNKPYDEKLFDKGLEYYNDSIFNEAFVCFEEAANLNNTHAQFLLGICYCYGNGVEPNMEKAFESWHKAAEKGMPEAQTNVGICYYSGDGVKRNYKKAVEWFTLSAEQNDENAQYHLGLCYYNGYGVKKDMMIAKELMKRSAEKGYELAKSFLNEDNFTSNHPNDKKNKPNKKTGEQNKINLEEQKLKEREDLKILFNQDENGICQNQIVDLGLSVKWAGWNIGAASTYEYGGFYGWGDATGMKQSTNDNDYPNVNPPLNICGNPLYDIVRKQWGGNWRLPTKEEFKELNQKCKVQPMEYNDIKGLKVTGPNGNSMFLPFAGYIDYKRIDGRYDPYDITIKGRNISGKYYSGEADKETDVRPYTLYIDAHTWNGNTVYNIGFRFHHHSIRGVYTGNSD